MLPRAVNILTSKYVKNAPADPVVEILARAVKHDESCPSERISFF